MVGMAVAWWLLASGMVGLLRCEWQWFYDGGDVLDLERPCWFSFSYMFLCRGWGGETKRKREKEIVKIKIKKYLNKLEKKRILECWCIVKWYDIINKVAFWDGKIRWDSKTGCGCSNGS